MKEPQLHKVITDITSKTVDGLAVSPNSKYLAIAGREKRLLVWNLQTHEPHYELSCPKVSDNSAAAFTPDGNSLIASGFGRGLAIWDMKTGELAGTRNVPETEATMGVFAVAPTPDGKCIIAGDTKGLWIWIPDVLVPFPLFRKTKKMLGAEIGGVKSLAVTDKSVLSALYDGALWMVDWVETAKYIDEHLEELFDKEDDFCEPREILTHGINTVAVTPDGKHVVVGNILGGIEVLDLETGKNLWEPSKCWNTHKGGTSVVTTTPDSRYIVSGGEEDFAVRVWDLEGRLLHTLTEHRQMITCLTVTPDGQYIISGSKDKTIRIWTLDSS